MPVAGSHWVVLTNIKQNVSTNEVSDVLGKHPQIAECNVYGVQVPRADGRCGCAALVPAGGVSPSSLDFAGLAKHLIQNLPRYAVPIFIRIVPELHYTGTMKLQKGKMRAEGVDPEKIAKGATDTGSGFDMMYWLPPGKAMYEPFEARHWQDMCNGSINL